MNLEKLSVVDPELKGYIENKTLNINQFYPQAVDKRSEILLY